MGVTEAELRGLKWPTEFAFVVESGGLLRRHPVRLSLHGCEVLADDADWDAATWSMEPAKRAELAEAFAALFAQVPGDVIVQALWEGEQPEQSLTESRSDFLERVRPSALGTRARYTVTA